LCQKYALAGLLGYVRVSEHAQITNNGLPNGYGTEIIPAMV
jgi:hypothetical protein